MAALHFWSERECLLHIQCITCNDVRIFMVQMLEPSDRRDGKAQSLVTSNGAICPSTGARDFA